MTRPQRLPKGQPTVSGTEERWDVGRIEIENESVLVLDTLKRDDLETSERQERILTTEEVDDLFSSNARHTFLEWCAIIHASAKKRGY